MDNCRLSGESPAGHHVQHHNKHVVNVAILVKTGRHVVLSLLQAVLGLLGALSCCAGADLEVYVVLSHG